jgi:Fur family transcriptional regulator, peroxide stress response regulator
MMSKENPPPGLSSHEIKSRLTAHGLKATYQRIVIYEALMGLDHPTAEQIFAYIRERYPSISLATVYKTLETFERSGLALKVQASGAQHRYDANVDSHNHFYCTKTGRIIDYKDDDLEQLIYEHLKKKLPAGRFRVNNIHLQITGELRGPDKG